MREIQNIIAAATAAYTEFAAAEVDKETRDAVGNAVRFLVADLNSVNQFTARQNTMKGAA